VGVVVQHVGQPVHRLLRRGLLAASCVRGIFSLMILAGAFVRTAVARRRRAGGAPCGCALRRASGGCNTASRARQPDPEVADGTPRATTARAHPTTPTLPLPPAAPARSPVFAPCARGLGQHAPFSGRAPMRPRQPQGSLPSGTVSAMIAIA